ncbi:MAG: molybdate ABC transporter substrate-binding protein [Stellaceae bacterium]
MRRRIRLARLVAVVVAGLLTALHARAAAAEELMVLAAATVKNALDQVAVAYRSGGGTMVQISYGPSPALVKQLEAGAPADLFLSADPDWMDDAAAKGLIRKETRVDLLSSRLVLIAPAGSAISTDIKPGFPLAQLLGDGRLAMCDPMMMPAGRYGRASLQSLGVWPAVEGHVANANSVRAALAYVSRGEAPLGVVFDTDAAIDPGVRIVGMFPRDSHPPIVYPAAITAASRNPEAPKLLAFLQSADAKAIFVRLGYTFMP